jgi:hypothetical protein
MTQTPQSKGRLYFLDMGLGSYPQITGRIMSCRTNGSDTRTLVPNLRHIPDGIAIDPQREHIYWTNMGQGMQNDGSIQRCNMDGSDIKTIVPVSVTHTPKQCIIAPRQGKLYWCDREGMRVMRANVDGSDIEVLVNRGEREEDKLDATRWCVGIAVDEANGVMYWTQKGPSKGGKGRIFRAPLEMKSGETPERRTDIETIFENLPEPIDLELDEERQVLYWTDRGDPPFGNTVNCAWVGNMGSGASKADAKKVGERQVLVRKLHEGIGLSLDLKSGRMFFGDLNGSVYEANLDGSGKRTILEDMGDVTGVAYLPDED